MAIVVGILFYTIMIAAVAYVAPWRNLTGEKFMTAVAFEHAVGSRWIVSVILAAALLSLFKVFNGNFVAASRLLFAIGRRGLMPARVGQIHPAQPDAVRRRAVASVLRTAACMFLGDAILVPVTEVGSVAAAAGCWPPAPSYYRIVSDTAPAPGGACGLRCRIADDPDEGASLRARDTSTATNGWPWESGWRWARCQRGGQERGCRLVG